MADALSGKPWDGAAANYDDAGAYCDACLVNLNSGSRSTWTKGQCHLPVKEPSGAVNRAALGAASAALAGGRGHALTIDPAAKKAAARKLAALYTRFKLDCPPMVKRMAL